MTWPHSHHGCRPVGWAGRQRNGLAVRPLRTAGLGGRQPPWDLAAAGTAAAGCRHQQQTGGWSGGRLGCGERCRLGNGRRARGWRRGRLAGWRQHAVLATDGAVAAAGGPATSSAAWRTPVPLRAAEAAALRSRQLCRSTCSRCCCLQGHLDEWDFNRAPLPLGCIGAPFEVWCSDGGAGQVGRWGLFGYLALACMAGACCRWAASVCVPGLLL